MIFSYPTSDFRTVATFRTYDDYGPATPPIKQISTPEKCPHCGAPTTGKEEWPRRDAMKCGHCGGLVVSK